VRAIAAMGSGETLPSLPLEALPFLQEKPEGKEP
jgi:hypothetical protein